MNASRRMAQFIVGRLHSNLSPLVLLFALLSFASAVGQAKSDMMVSQLRFAHFSSDAPAYEVYVDGELFSESALDFGDTSDWTEFVPGIYRIALVPIEATVADTLVGPSVFTIEAGAWQTIALIGLAETGSLRAHILTEDYSEIATGETRLSFFHAIENAPALDLYANDGALLELVGFPGQFQGEDGLVNDGFVQVDVIAGLYDMETREHGADGATFVDLGEVDLFANQNTLLAMIGTVDNPQFIRVNTSLDIEGGDGDVSDLGDGVGFLRFAHFSSGTPDVDIYIDSALSDIQQLGFSDVTEYAAVPAGVYTIDVAPVNTSLNDRVIGPLEITVATGDAVTVAAIGTLANDTLTAQAFTEEYDPESSFRVGMGVFHAIPGLGPVDVLVNEQIRVGLLGFPGSQGSNDGLATFDLVRGIYDIRVVLSEDADEVLVELEDFRLLPNRQYLITLVLADPPFLLTTTPTSQLTLEDVE